MKDLDLTKPGFQDSFAYMFDPEISTEIGDRHRKETGAHFTPPKLAQFVARQILNVSQDFKSKAIRVLDPAVGDGELLEALLDLLSPSNLKLVVYGFDTNANALKAAERRLHNKFPNVEFHLEEQDFVELLSDGSTLFGKKLAPFDLVISNPPYVRTQVMGAKAAQKLAEHFQLSGRVDLYYAFIRGIAELLRPGGVVGVICSNRFMTIKSGADIRRGILSDFDIHYIWDLGDTKLFEAAVLPAVLLLRKKNGDQQDLTAGFSSIYTTSERAETKVDTFSDALERTGVLEINGQNFLIRHGRLDNGKNLGDIWKLATTSSDNWLATVEANTFCTFRDLGKIRVGVKTTADKIFVRRDWNELPKSEQPELLKPLITHFIARRYKAEPIKEQILYTHEIVNGKRKVIDISKHPRAKKYLEQHREKLEGRTYVIEAGRQWYEIWVPQSPDSWAQPKLVFPDISEKPIFYIDLEGSVVNGDCYWLVLDEKQKSGDLLWLALAVANSKFIEEFYDHKFHNKLYSGRRRFMSQYVEQFPIPDPKLPESRKLIEMAKTLHAEAPETASLEPEVDRLVSKVFGLSAEKPKRGRVEELAVT